MSGFPPQDIDQAIIVDLAREPLGIGNGSVPNIQYVQAGGTQVPFGDDVADIIVCSSTIQYMKDDREFLQELSRLLKPGGSLVLGAPSKNHLNKILDLQPVNRLLSGTVVLTATLNG